MEIHAIYIYFILNAFVSGIAFGSNEKWYYSVSMLFFGLPFCILYVAGFIIIGSAGLISRKLLIIPWYRLYFTDYFGNVKGDFIRIRRDQYFGRVKFGKKYMNAYDKFFIRQLDKKYKYGITTEKLIY